MHLSACFYAFEEYSRTRLASKKITVSRNSTTAILLAELHPCGSFGSGLLV